MHKLYKEHYLYEMSDKNINSVEQIASSVVFDLKKSATRIDCDDQLTASVVFDDVCSRLIGNKTFTKVKKFLVNLDNIKEINVKQTNNQSYRLIISFGEDSGVMAICSSEEEAKKLESEILTKIVERKEELANNIC